MDASLTLRRLREDEFLAYGRAMETVFLERLDDDRIRQWAAVCPTDRFLAVTGTDDRDHVGTAGIIPMTISMPWADPVPVAGVTAITVRPDHRRRGVLRAMMEQLLDDAVDAGEPLATLFASEGTIYGRFGFGPSAPAHTLRLQREALATIDGDVGLVELVDADTARDRFPAVEAAHARLRGGAMQRTPAWWSMWLDNDRDADPDGEHGPRWHAWVPERGYVVFRAASGAWADRRPDGHLKVVDLRACDAEAEAALWSFLASVDLVTTIDAPSRPVDDPVRFLVANEADVDVRAAMPLWSRLVDLPAALTARGYDTADRARVRRHRRRSSPRTRGAGCSTPARTAPPASPRTPPPTSCCPPRPWPRCSSVGTAPPRWRTRGGCPAPPRTSSAASTGSSTSHAPRGPPSSSDRVPPGWRRSARRSAGDHRRPLDPEEAKRGWRPPGLLDREDLHGPEDGLAWPYGPLSSVRAALVCDRMASDNTEECAWPPPGS